MAASVRATRVRFDRDRMWLSLSDGRVPGVPLAWLPRLKRERERGARRAGSPGAVCIGTRRRRTFRWRGCSRGWATGPDRWLWRRLDGRARDRLLLAADQLRGRRVLPRRGRRRRGHELEPSRVRSCARLIVLLGETMRSPVRPGSFRGLGQRRAVEREQDRAVPCTRASTMSGSGGPKSSRAGRPPPARISLARPG